MCLLCGHSEGLSRRFIGEYQLTQGHDHSRTSHDCWNIHRRHRRHHWGRPVFFVLRVKQRKQNVLVSLIVFVGSNSFRCYSYNQFFKTLIDTNQHPTLQYMFICVPCSSMFNYFVLILWLYFWDQNFKTLDHWSSLIEHWKPDSPHSHATNMATINLHGVIQNNGTVKDSWVNPLCLGVSSMVIWCHLGVVTGSHLDLSMRWTIGGDDTWHWDWCIWCVDLRFPDYGEKKRVRLAHHYQHIPKCLW